MRHYRWLLCLILVLAALPAAAQVDSLQADTAGAGAAPATRKLSLKGYVKELHTFIPVQGLDSALSDHLLHNRLNFRYQADTALALVVEVRSRLFYGDLLRQVPGYAQLIDAGNDVWDLSLLPLQSRSLLLHTMLDRAYAEWSRSQLEVRLGRQRINWGLNLVWNPNDLFNTFSYFDFDYEERPGSDALRLRYFQGVAGGVELAARLTADPDRRTVAGLWKFNRHQYDWQVLGGVYQRMAALGGGWAGNIGTAGFKGELTYFHPFRQWRHQTGQVLFSLSADYSFANALYLHGSALYNSRGTPNPPAVLLQAFSPGRLSVRDLSPYRYSLFLQTSYPFHPLLNGSLAGMYFPQDQAFFLSPVLTYSALPNLDLDALSQLFFDPQKGNFSPSSRLIFLRLKWSF
jgi:hypothetical protein